MSTFSSGAWALVEGSAASGYSRKQCQNIVKLSMVLFPPIARSLAARRSYLGSSENRCDAKSQEQGGELEESHNASKDNTDGTKGVDGRESAEQ
jgi:hypothetical protein